MSNSRHALSNFNYRLMAFIGEVLIVLGALVMTLIGLQQASLISFNIPQQGTSLFNVGSFQGFLTVIMAGLIVLLVISFKKFDNPLLYPGLVALLAIIGGHTGGLLVFIGAILVALSYILD